MKKEEEEEGKGEEEEEEEKGKEEERRKRKTAGLVGGLEHLLFLERTWLHSQDPHGSQPSVTPLPEDPMPSLASVGSRHTVYIHT